MKRECTFGERLWRIRSLELDMTQEKFSEKLFISKQTLGQYERNKATPNLSTAIEFAEILGVTLNYLSGYSDVTNRFANSTDEAKKVAVEYDKTSDDWRAIIKKILDIR